MLSANLQSSGICDIYATQDSLQGGNAFFALREIILDTLGAAKHERAAGPLCPEAA
jgi:hypothetical protein